MPAMYTETIEVDRNTCVGLTGDNTIVVDVADGLVCTRLTVSDPEGLARALTRLDERRAEQSEPIDNAMRRAIFAALRRHYGGDLTRAERLARLSEFAGREVPTINSLTRVEGGRILDRLAGRAPAHDTGTATATGPADDGGGWHHED